MSSLFEEIPSASQDENREEKAFNGINLKAEQLYLSLLVVTGVFFILFVLFWSGYIFAYGAGWYALLSAMLCFLTARNIARKETGVYKLREASPLIKIGTGVAFLTTLCAFLLLSIRPPLNYPERVLKPIFVLICLFCLQGVYFVLIRAPTAPVAQEDFLVSFIESETFARMSSKNFDERRKKKQSALVKEKALKCRLCCQLFCPLCLFFLVTVAGIVVMLVFGREIVYLEAENEFFLPASTKNSEEVMNFRCSGEGEPLVLLFHGFMGQALDLEHMRVGVAEETTVCSFSRLGYGLSHVMGSANRVSQNFAIELDTALQSLDIGVDQFNETILVGHSMAGYNMRAYDKQFPGRVAAMVLVDPVAPETTSDCFAGGQNLNGALTEGGVRLIDSGLGLLSEFMRTYKIVAPTDELPEDVQKKYIASLFQSHYFQTSIEEGLNFGASCAFVEDHTADYPVTVFVAEQGIFLDDLEEANLIQTFSNNLESETILLEGDDAGHVDVVMNIKFAQEIIDKTIEYVSAVRGD